MALCLSWEATDTAGIRGYCTDHGMAVDRQRVDFSRYKRGVWQACWSQQAIHSWFNRALRLILRLPTLRQLLVAVDLFRVGTGPVKVSR